MLKDVLVETGFLLALNPKDKHHNWALNILREARARKIMLYISPAAPIELSLIMKSKKYDEKDIYRVLEALDSAINRYIKPFYPSLEMRHIIYAAKLRMRYTELGFFDSLHASIAIKNNLIYYDLDEVLNSIVRREMER